MVHLDATVDLRQIFAKCDLENQLFGFSENPVSIQFFRPKMHLVQGLRICREPGQSMCGGLIGFDQSVGDAAINRYQRAHRSFGLIKNSIDRRQRLGGEFKQIFYDDLRVHRQVLSIMSHLYGPFLA